MAYNLDIFENLVFAVPSARKLRNALLGLGVGYGLVAFVVGYLTIPAITGFGTLVGSVAVVLVPSLVTAVATRRFPDFPRRWGYLLGIITATVATVCLVGEFLLEVSEGWRLLIFGAATTLLSLQAIFVLTASTNRPFSLVVASLPMPVTLLSVPALGARWFGLPPLDATRALVVTAGVSVGLAVSVFVHERIFDANVPYIDGSRLTSTLLTGREEDIDTGYPTEPRVQSLVVKSADGPASDPFSLVVPWVHPGPLINFGGGAVAPTVIEGVNENASGFFAKVPCTHEEDATEVAIADRILEAVPDPGTTGQASKMLHREYDSTTFYGRRYGYKSVVFVEPDRFGDFPPSIFAERITPSETVVIDRHAYEADDERGIRYGSVGAERFRESLDSFLNELETQPLGEYKAGTAVETDGKEICALVERVDGQRTVLLGSNENEVSETVRAVSSEPESEFDHTVFFSTDTHHDLHDLAARTQVEPDRIQSTVDAAAESVSSAKAGVDVARAEETRLLGTEYHALMYTINYVLRSFTVSLVVLYVMAAIAVFL